MLTKDNPNGRICVLGGGLAGCATAYFLSRMGRRVAVLERRNIASGAAGRNGGMIMKIDGRDTRPEPILLRWKYARENDRMLDAFSAELNTDIEVWRRGSLDLACTDQEADLLRRITRMQKEETGDEEIEYLDRRQLAHVSPPLDGTVVVGARYRPSDGCLNPYKLTTALARQARRLGAVILTHTAAREIIVRDNRVVGVRTEQGEIETDCVVNAMNGWAAGLTPDVPIVPLRSLAVLTEPLPPVPALTFEAELNMKIVYGATQTKRGNLLVGGPPEAPATFDGQYNEDVSRREFLMNTDVLAKLMPVFRGVSVIRAWAGAMGNTPDGLPCVGPHPTIRGLYMAAGYPNGMSYAPVTARLLAELIVEGQSSIDLEALSPARFKGQVYRWPERYDYTVLAEYLNRR